MYKSTLQQIFFFLVTSVLNFYLGKHLIEMNGMQTFLDFGAIMLFFISFTFFLNYFLRLTSKLIRSLSF